jgi:hypothetical protein
MDPDDDDDDEFQQLTVTSNLINGCRSDTTL